MLGQHLVDLVIAWMMEPADQSSGFHDHAGLAKPALGNVFFEPCQLAGMTNVGGKAFYGGDVFARRIGNVYLTRPYGVAVFVDGAGAANPNAASIFCPCQSQIIPEHPQQRSVGVYVDPVELAIDVKTVFSHAEILSEFDDAVCHPLAETVAGTIRNPGFPF